MKGKNILPPLNMQVAKNWDANVQIRAEDLEQGTDFTYVHIIKPWVLEHILMRTEPGSRILDIGCGCGYLANAVFQNGRTNITGLDLSAGSISYARSRYPDIPFVCQDICAYAPAEKFDFCLAIMALNNMPDMDGFFSAISRLLAPGSRALLAIPHPCFWPQRHLNLETYSYWDERAYEYPFATKGRQDYHSNVLYFHRMLKTYLQAIEEHGFQTIGVWEPLERMKQQGPDILGLELARQ